MDLEQFIWSLEDKVSPVVRHLNQVAIFLLNFGKVNSVPEQATF